MQVSRILIALLASLCCANALKCYVCNSITDSSCDVRPVDRNYIVDCDVGRNTKTSSGQLIQIPPVINATVCWKQRQDIEGTIIVDRICGRAGQDSNTCYDRVGTKKIKIRYCACTGPECNGSGVVGASGVFIAASILAGYFAIGH